MQRVYLGVQPHASSRLLHGLALLEQELEYAGYRSERTDLAWSLETYRERPEVKIYIGNREDCTFLRTLEEREVLIYHSGTPGKEGFYLASLPGNLIVVSGAGDTGALYGAQELARLIRKAGRIPELIAWGETPEFMLRGPVLGLQKTTVEPPRRTYEYPITPDRFPWFYDKPMWLEYLDMLCAQRSNVVYIWTGHPFASLVKLREYPEALEVTEEQYRQNVETFRWLASEADKRGIWVVLNFYNIHIPLPFAEKHGLELHQPKPMPITADYTRKSIAEFVRSFPNVGIMLCLGEALHGSLYGAEWFTETIIAGVKEGLADLNVKEYPPIILRAHAVKAEPIIEKALPLYPILYTEAKYNGESLTTWTPRGGWVKTHNNLSTGSRRTACTFIRCSIGIGRTAQTRLSRASSRRTATGSGMPPGRATPGIRTAIRRPNAITGRRSWPNGLVRARRERPCSRRMKRSANALRGSCGGSALRKATARRCRSA